MSPDGAAAASREPELAPTVSVVTMFLNEERFLADSVESVLAQTFQDWELLLVNDGSTDGSERIARKYAAAHPGRIRYLDHEGGETRGMSASRNLGIQHARGQYIAFIDADDVWLPLKLEQQVAILRLYPKVAMVYGQARFWYGWTALGSDAARDYMIRPTVPTGVVIEPPDLLRRCLNDENQFPTGSAIMVRRSVIDRLGGYDEAFPLYEDIAFYCKVMLDERVYVSDACWHKYRQHERSASARAVAEGVAHARKGRYLQWLSGYLTARNITDRALKRSLAGAMWPHRLPHMFVLYRRLRRLLGHLSRALLPSAVRARLKGRVSVR